MSVARRKSYQQFAMADSSATQRHDQSHIRIARKCVDGTLYLIAISCIDGG
jgi:hypothetical protein